MTVLDTLQGKIILIDTYLNELVPELDLPCKDLFKAARYSLFSGGKRLRPLLTLLAAEATGGAIEAAIAPACAIELVHTYSLIHDDLPSMDNDDLRRGKPTLHKVYPEGHAILTGDYLLTYAFQVLATAEGLTDPQKTRMILLLSQAAGASGMIGGQVMDLQATGQQIDLLRLQQIHQNKTGALISASLQMGGIAANAAEKEIEVLKQFGNCIGQAFQIADDLLDDEDAVRQRPSYVTLLGRDRSQEMVKDLLDVALTVLSTIAGNTIELNHLANYMVHRTY